MNKINWSAPIEAMHERFWSKVDRSAGADACWLWTACRNRKGYGEFQVGSTSKRPATHIALEMAGSSRPEGMMALHSCDNPGCVNPSHLRWGTAADNARDRDTRNRFTVVRGQDRRQAKLTDQAVRSIMRDRRGYRQAAVAFGVSKSLIRNIRTGKAWRHVTGL